jgi:hypothetical protein
MPTPKNAPYKKLQRRGSKLYPRLLSRPKPGKQVRLGRAVYETVGGALRNVVAERHIRRKLGLSPRQYRIQKRAARRAAKLRGQPLN